MGFSPGDFIDDHNGVKEREVHWELKDGLRIILWNRDESEKILDLDYTEAQKACRQLETLLYLCE